MTNSIRFTFSVGDTTIAVLISIWSKTNRIGYTRVEAPITDQPSDFAPFVEKYKGVPICHVKEESN